MKGILGKLKRVAQAALVAGGFAFGANAEPTIKYTSPVYADGVASHGIAYWTTNTITTYTTVGSSSSAVTWGTSGATSWYVVPSGNFQIDGGITCQGHVNLILGEGAKLVVTNVDDYLAAIATDEEGSFTIYGQPDGAGVLEATSSYSGAGIGGRYGAGASKITINGGTVTATGSNNAAGIGGGEQGDASNITINGGMVTACGGFRGAGIGGGNSGGGSNITINGGTVTATGSNYGAGIGGGIYGGGSNITINGGKVSATGGPGAAGIGGGGESNGSGISINGGTVTAIGIAGGAGIGGGKYGSGTKITIGAAKVFAFAEGYTNWGDSYYPDVIGNGGEASADENSVVINPSAEVLFNLTEDTAMPDDFEGFAVVTPEAAIERSLVGGCAEWKASTAFALTNAVSAATTNVVVGGDSAWFAKNLCRVKLTDGSLKLTIELPSLQITQKPSAMNGYEIVAKAQAPFEIVNYAWRKISPQTVGFDSLTNLCSIYNGTCVDGSVIESSYGEIFIVCNPASKLPSGGAFYFTCDSTIRPYSESSGKVESLGNNEWKYVPPANATAYSFDVVADEEFKISNLRWIANVSETIAEGAGMTVFPAEVGENGASYFCRMTYSYDSAVYTGDSESFIYVEMPTAPILAQPTPVANTKLAVYTNGVISAETSPGSGLWNAWSNRTAVVVYTAEDDYFFEGGATVITNAFNTFKNPATAPAPDAPTPTLKTYSYVAPVYVDGVASHGIAYWTTNEVGVYTVVKSSLSYVEWGEAGVTNWFVVKEGDFQIDGGIICYGHVNLILSEGAKLVVTNVVADRAGIATDEYGSFTVYGQPDGAGVLEVTGGIRGAGIGGNWYGAGSYITINAGTVTAIGGHSGAGIGGNKGLGEYITINGGTVTAIGGQCGAGIGGGEGCNGSNLTINGGTVTAIGLDGAAGIGGGYEGSGSNIKITNATVFVCGVVDYSRGWYNCPDGIGNGAYSWEEASGVVIDPSAKVLLNLTGIWDHDNYDWLEEMAPMPADFEGFIVMTPETLDDDRVLVGGCAEWTAATTFSLTNAVTGATGTIEVNGDMTEFANDNFNLRHADDALKVRLGIPVGDDAFAWFSPDGWCGVFGTGDMWSYDVATNSALWAYRDSISGVYIAYGITGVGANSFAYMRGVKDIDISETVTNIAEKAFYHCTYITNLVVGAGVETVGSNAIERCYSLESVYFKSTSGYFACQDAFKVTARITMDGDKPIIEAVPDVEILEYERELQGKTNLTDSVWIPINDPESIPYGLRFFRWQYVAPPPE